MNDPAAARSRLIDERDFALRSIADLHSQRAAGDIAEAEFRCLLGDYTAQAAAVLRALDASDAPVLARPARRGPLHHWWVPATLIAAAVAGLIVLPGALRDRGAGDTITGNAQNQAPTIEDLARQADEHPDDADTQLVYARALLARRELVSALEAYDRAAQADPTNPEPHAYSGWIVLLAGLSDDALVRIDRAIAADPDYPDARFFRAIAMRNLGRGSEAVDELETYLRLAPVDDPLRPDVEALLDELAAGETTSTRG